MPQRFGPVNSENCFWGQLRDFFLLPSRVRRLDVSWKMGKEPGAEMAHPSLQPTERHLVLTQREVLSCLNCQKEVARREAYFKILILNLS